MNLKQYTVSLLLTSPLILLGACSDEKETQTGNLTPVNIQAGIPTRAADTDWHENDRIGITMIEANNDVIVEDLYNRPYITTEGDGKFAPFNSNATIYYSQYGDEARFKTYYPYNENVNSSLMVPVNTLDQTDLPLIDLMTAEHPGTYSKTNPDVSLDFYHRLTKLTFDIEFEEAADRSVAGGLFSIEGMYTTATYDLLNEQLINIATQQSIDVPVKNTDPTGKKRTAIVLPRPKGEGVEFSIDFQSTGESFSAKMSPDLELQAGYHYQFTVTIKKNELLLSVQIIEWKDGGTYDGALILNSTVTNSINVNDGDEIRLLLQNPTTSTFNYLTTYQYSETNNRWTPDPIVYWNDLPDGNSVFRGYSILADAYNITQLPDIVVSSDKTVQKNNPVNLVLERAVAQVVVTLKSSNQTFNATELAEMTIQLPNYYTGATMNNEGAFIPGTDQTTVHVAENVGKNGDSSIAIIQPQTIQKGQTVAILTYSPTGVSYTVKYNEDIEFKAGKVTVLDIDILKNEIEVGVSIVEWEKGLEIPLVATLNISGSLENSDDFFKDKTIQIYNINAFPQVYITNTYEFSYENTNGEYQWTGPTLYWESFQGSPRWAAAYYPDQKPNLTSENPRFTWTIDENQQNGYSNWDLLWSKPATYFLKAVNLPFEHALSQLLVTLKAGEGFDNTDLDNVKVTLENLSLGGTIDMVNSSFSNLTTPTTVTPYPASTDSDNREFSCLVMPGQTISAINDFISVELKDYNLNFKGKLGSLTLQSGKQHQITVTINKTKIDLSATLKDWEQAPGGNVTIQ